MLSPRIFSFFSDLQKKDLDRDILKPLIIQRELSVYDSPEYIKDMGTPDRYYSVIEDIHSGKSLRKIWHGSKKRFSLTGTARLINM